MKAAIIPYTQGLAYQLAAKGHPGLNSLSPGNTYFPRRRLGEHRAEQS